MTPERGRRNDYIVTSNHDIRGHQITAIPV